MCRFVLEPTIGTVVLDSTSAEIEVSLETYTEVCEIIYTCRLSLKPVSSCEAK